MLNINKLKEKIAVLVRRIVFGSASSPERFLIHLKEMGIEIGEGTEFFSPMTTIVDTQNPKLIKIGKNVRVTAGCKILTHDFSSSVLAGKYGECIGAIGSVKIGDNVFIGVNTVILRNTRIGNNVIIGAGSVVSGVVEDDSVYVGVPAKKIMTIDDFYIKRREKVDSEIKNVASQIDLKNKEEAWKYLREYACYFEDAPKSLQEKQMKDMGYFEFCQKYYKKYVFKYNLKSLEKENYESVKD